MVRTQKIWIIRGAKKPFKNIVQDPRFINSRKTWVKTNTTINYILKKLIVVKGKKRMFCRSRDLKSASSLYCLSRLDKSAERWQELHCALFKVGNALRPDF